MKKFVAFLLALTMVMSMAACGEKKTAPDAPQTAETETQTENTGKEETPAEPEENAEGYQDPYAELTDDYEAVSSAIYNDQLGDFLAAYETAKEEQDNLDTRYALMAVAEAKLLESAVMLPVTAGGGNYGIGRNVPRSTSTVFWGTDWNRYHSVISTEEMLKKEDRLALKALWAETKGTGTYLEQAKAYLKEHGYTQKDSYTVGNPTDIKGWDVQSTSREPDYRVLVQCVDGLVEYDAENVMQPALAESWEVSDDGLTYTFHIRQGVKWVDSQGREIAELKAQDFVAGVQHMLDTMGGLEYLVDGKIVGASEYISGETTDFGTVGVKALDDYTLQYSLIEPMPYFLSMLSYSVFAPLCSDYYIAQGGKFGEEFDASAEDYMYGKGPDSIAYCGPFVVTNYTPENTIAFKANAAYWNPDSNNISTLTFLFNDGKDPLKAYTDCKSGLLDSCGLSASAVEAAKNDDLFNDFVDVGDTDGGSFCGSFNMNRAAFENFNDGAAPSEKDDEAKIRTIAALRNVHFRRALAFSIDRPAGVAQMIGEDLKLTSVRNAWTPGTFISLENETTIDINGEPTTFPTGTYYGEIVQAQIDADGDTIKVWDPAADGGIGSSDGFDGWYNPEAAKAELEQAITELAAQGVEISAENPIYIDNPYASSVEWQTNKANALKQGVEEVLGGSVIINLVACNTDQEMAYTGFYAERGEECNFDYSDGFGWGPDYGDPSAYLDAYLPDFAGSMTRGMGIF